LNILSEKLTYSIVYQVLSIVNCSKKLVDKNYQILKNGVPHLGVAHRFGESW
jgi:hypothetical protein